MTNDSSLSHALTTLADNKRVVHAALPYAAPPGRKSKRYSVADPYLRFWLRFVGPNIRRSIAVVPISGPRIEEAWTSYRGKAIEPVIQQGLERLLPDPQFGNPRYVGGYWTRNNDVEVDLVGAEAAAPEKVAFVGSIKCGRRNPVRIGGLCRRYIALLRAHVLPALADQLRAAAKVGTVHYSTLIEGNELPIIEAERAARGQLDPSSWARIELVNYVTALDLIEARLEAEALQLTPGFLKRLHGIATRGLGREDHPHFKPHHEGEWRDGVAVVVDRVTHAILHGGPPADEVPGRMQGMFDWLHAKAAAAGEPAFVLAGVMHYGITDVHPFADGNGRAARLFQTALLMQADALPGRMFSFERYYAEDRATYYAALRSVRDRTLNMESWLEYFLRGLAEEYERVAATVADLSSLVAASGEGPLRLRPSQERALSSLRIEGRREFSRRDYEQAAGVGRSAAGEDLKELVRHGALTPRGAGPSTRYALSATSGASAGAESRGRPRTWTDPIIERELRAFIGGRQDWPSPEEFRSRGKGALYAAASRAGGIARWRKLMGL